jgi:hypothetical protein
MKQCPVCKTTYTDDSLSFCLSDGASLFFISDEEETRVIPKVPETVRINVPAQQTAPIFTPVIPHQTTQSGGRSKTVSLLIGVLALVILLFIGFAAFVLLKPSDKKSDSSTSPSPTISQTPNDEMARLKKEVEDLKNQKSPTPTSTPPLQKPAGETARVNSPGDGFLALRSAPNAETGYQILKIPHGASVDVLGCQSFSEKIGSRNGRWCQVNYAGQSGWAFDAWLNY